MVWPEIGPNGELAKSAGLSRSTLLYYDRLGLLRPVGRSESNYRLYSATDADSETPDGHDEEGWFFTWTPAELIEILGPELAA